MTSRHLGLCRYRKPAILSVPSSATGYLGFPAQTQTDLEYQSGKNIRLTFGGSAKFFVRNALNASPPPKKVHVGATLIVRVDAVRLRMT